jgi:isopentenyl-diphosphate delta-isomerase
VGSPRLPRRGAASRSRAAGAGRGAAVARRKAEHIRICLEQDVAFRRPNGFERYRLVHAALPEADLAAIDTAATFLGRRFALPIMIEAMTGGTAEAARINRRLAEAAERCGIGMGLGSQRAMLLDPAAAATYRVRDRAPSIFLSGNIGAAQLREFGPGRIARGLEAVGADALTVHLNPAQELCQPEGDTDWRGVLQAISDLCRALDRPVIVKETGCGLSAAAARRLEAAGAAALDTGGAGGTSWPRVESRRGSRIAALFAEWGIPTAESLVACVESVAIPVIASGGIRTAIEIVKALALGAVLTGMALPFLKPATQSTAAVVAAIEALGREIRAVMFLIGARRIAEIGPRKIERLAAPGGEPPP